jgi:hypothetical protein
LIFQNDELGRFVAAPRYAEQRAHSEFLHVPTLQHRDTDPAFLGDFPGLFGDAGRCHDVGGMITEVPDIGRCLRAGLSADGPALGLSHLVGGADDRDPLEVLSIGPIVASVFRETVASEQRAFHHGLGQLGCGDIP